MSRIGKLPVEIPNGVEVTFAGEDLTVKGPKGALNQWIDPRITVEIVDQPEGNEGKQEVRFSRSSDEREDRALHGLYRALCRNMVEGVTKGYEKRLEIHGVGYQATLQDNKLSLVVGFSNLVFFDVPAGLVVTCPNNTTIDVAGSDRQLVGQFAAKVRAVRPSEPYKGKGIRYAGEKIRRKAGKSMAAGK